MDRARSLLEATGLEDLAQVASGSTGLPKTTTEQRPTIVELSTVHWDKRTIGLYRVSGACLGPKGTQTVTWSAVAKVIDHSITGPEGWVAPDQEVLSYTQGHFSEDRVSFRPAKCFRITRPEPSVVILWLEDLTGLPRPPFDVEQLSQMARHLGQWNGLHAKVRRALPFDLPTNAHARRWKQSGFERFLGRFDTLHDHSYTRTIYGQLSTRIARDLYEAGDVLHCKVLTQERSLAFGDCNVGNLFPTPRGTVAVDWASLTYDPIGVDAGCMIGSAMTFGARGSVIVEEEQRLFDSYLQGLQDAGLTYDRRDVRRAYLSLLAVYLFYSAMMPALLQTPGEFFTREFYEGRYGAAWERIPEIVTGVVHSIPRCVDEMKQLAS